MRFLMFLSMVLCVAILLMGELALAQERGRGNDTSPERNGNARTLDLERLFSDEADEKRPDARRGGAERRGAKQHPNAMERFAGATPEDKLKFIRQYGERFPRTVEWLEGKPNAIARLQALSEEERVEALRKYETSPPPYVEKDIQERRRMLQQQQDRRSDARDTGNKDERKASRTERREAIKSLKEKFPDIMGKWEKNREQLRGIPTEERMEKLRAMAKDNPELAKRFEDIKQQREALLALPEAEREEKLKSIKAEFKKEREARREQFIARWDAASPERKAEFCETAKTQCEGDKAGKRLCAFLVERC